MKFKVGDRVRFALINIGVYDGTVVDVWEETTMPYGLELDNDPAAHVKGPWWAYESELELLEDADDGGAIDDASSGADGTSQ